MGVRTYADLTFQVGRNNDLSDKLADISFSQLLDTLDHATLHEVTLAAGETNFVVPFGDVAQGRLVFIQSDGDIQVTPGGGLATNAEVDGSGGTYPTGFAGGETLDIIVDDTWTLNVVFDSGDSTLADVIARINSFAALAGVEAAGGIPATVARTNGGSELRLVSPTTGEDSEIEIVAGGTALAVLGLTAGVTNGINSTAGQTPLQLLRPASAAGVTGAAGIYSYALMTLVTTSLVIDNLSADDAARLVVVVAGDVLSSPPTDC